MPVSSNPDRNLDYQFYFLFRTYCPQGEDKLPEPFQEFGSLQGIGIRIDTDKRLFRRNAPSQKPLAEWQTQLKTAWDDICQTYSHAFNSQPTLPRAVNYCEKALLGIALVLWDESLDRHEVTKLRLVLLKLCYQPGPSIFSGTYRLIKIETVYISTEAEIWRYFPSPPAPLPEGEGRKKIREISASVLN